MFAITRLFLFIACAALCAPAFACSESVPDETEATGCAHDWGSATAAADKFTDGVFFESALSEVEADGDDDFYATVYTEDLSIRPGDGGAPSLFHVEIAATPAELMRGLMLRNAMPEDHGMLFVFGKEAERRFWMKNTLIPLDILFIAADGTIHSIHKNAQPLDETAVSSDGPVLHVLELNGGTVARLGIKPGDTVLHDVFGNAEVVP